MTASKNGSNLILLVSWWIWILVPDLSGAGPGRESMDIDAARAELNRLRAERAEHRERLDDPSEDILGDVSGSVTFEAVYRVGSDGSRDFDLWLWLDAEVGDDRKDPVTAAVSGRLDWDLNGNENRRGTIQPEGSAFEDYNAIEDDRLTEFVYTAYADFNRIGPLDKLRLGRQYHDGLTGGHFDGVQIFARPGTNTSLSVYGGVPVDYYKLTGDGAYSSDRIYGSSIVYRDLENLLLTVDVQGIRDRTDQFGTNDDYRAVLGLTYHFKENFRASVIENIISGQQRDLNGTLAYWDTENDLNVTVNYIWMPETIDDIAYHYTPFTDIMGPLKGYQLFRVMATKGLGDHLEVGADISVRQLTDGSDETVFNPEYTRTQASVTLLDLPIEDLSSTLHYEYWNTTDDDQFTLGGDIRQRLGRSHVLEAGSYFSKFKYRQLTYVDTVNVQTYFVQWRWAFARNLTFRVNGEVEDGEDDTYNMLSMAVTLRF